MPPVVQYIVNTIMVVAMKIAGGVMSVKTYLAIKAIATWAVVAAAVYGAGRILAPKIPRGSIRTSGLEVNVRDPAASRLVIYGQRRVSGVLYPVGVSGTNNEYLHLLLLIAGHECEELGDVYFGTDIVPLDGSGNAIGKYAGYARVKKHLGTYDQTVDTDLQTDLGATYWSNNHRLRGIAYLYIRLKVSQDLYPSGIPDFFCLVKGRRIYNPNDGTHDASSPDTWAWTNNPALCLSDWIWGVPCLDYNGDIRVTAGLGLTINTDLSTTALAEAAAICDEYVALKTTVNAGSLVPGTVYEIKTPGTTTWTAIGAANNNAGTQFTATGAGTGTGVAYETETRYTANGVISSATRAGDGIDIFRTAMAGDCVYIGGEWVIRAGAYRTPTVTLTDADYRAPIGSVTVKPSKRDLCNSVRGVYISPENEWQPADFPALTNSTYLTQDASEYLWQDMELQLTTSSATAQRLAKIVMEESRQAIQFTARCHLSAFQIQCTDTVMVTNSRFGWSSKVFRVMGWALATDNDENGNPMLGVDLMLRETASSIYTWSAEETAVDPAPDTLLPDVLTVVTASGLTLLSDETTSYRQADGTIMPRVRATWTSPADSAVLNGGRTSVESKLSSVSAYVIKAFVPGDKTEYFLTDVQSSDVIDVRVRHENFFGVRGGYATVTSHTVSQETLVDDPSNLCLNGRFASGDFGWPNKDNWIISATAGEVGYGAYNSVSTIGAIRNARRIACSPGDVFIVRGRVYGSTVALIVYFYDNSDNEIAYYVPSNYGTAGAWADSAIQVTAPAGAVYCYAAAFSSTSGEKIDNISLYRVAQLNELGPVSLDPAPQKFTTSITVSATHADPAAAIKYTTNGTPVLGNSTTFPSGGLFLTGTTTLRVRAYKTGAVSPENISLYVADSVTGQVATPSLSWVGQRGNATITVSAVCATSGATIKYKKSGGASTTYSASITLALNTYAEFWGEKSTFITSATAYIDNNWAESGGGIEP